MARPLRIEFPGAVYHVTSRGNAREPIVLLDTDRHAFMGVLERVVARYHWRCHAYCLMDNHYHLLVETPDANLSLGMRQLNGVYTQRFNRRHERVGHLFQGRFKAILVEKDAHLLELCRYVVLNPLRAGMVSHPKQWNWSSYNATAYAGRAPELLSVAWILSQFAPQKTEARKGYRKFVAGGMAAFVESPWKKVVGQIIFGGSEFVADLKGRIEGAKEDGEIPRQQRFAGRPSLKALFADQAIQSIAERNQQIASAHVKYGYTLTEIANQLGLHYSTVSRAFKGWRS